LLLSSVPTSLNLAKASTHFYFREDESAMFGWLMQMGADKSQADNVR